VVIALSKLTAQGQISVPAEVRRKLGIGPGSVLEWFVRGEEIVVRRAGRFTSADIHSALFSVKPLTPRKNAGDLKQGIREYIRKRHAGR
jgi:antitoxin PrlF